MFVVFSTFQFLDNTRRPRLPEDLRQLIREMAAGNATWGEEQIANELKLKLGIPGKPEPTCWTP
jgi:hypothetical protein